MHILLAEDEEQIAKLISYKLSLEGYSVFLAKNGQEAIDHFGSRDWSLLILDIMMPIRDGWQVLKDLRSSQWAKVPVLVLSAKGNQKDITNASELGATQYLRKPFDPSELAQLVKKMVDL